MSASAPVRSALVLERELVAPLLSPWVVPRDILRLGTTSRGCLQAVRNGMEALNVADRDLAQSDSRSGYNVLTDAHVITIVRCFPSLRSLTFGHNKNVTDKSMAAIATLPHLRELDISRCNITVAGMSSLPAKLESLRLGDTVIYDDYPRCFKNLLSDASLTAAVRRCPCLQSLDLFAVREITEKGLLVVADACPDLRSLNLYNLKGATDNAIIHLARSCKRLVKLNLSSCWISVSPPVKVTDAAIISVAENCSALEHLDIVELAKLTDASIIALARKCTALKRLSMSEGERKATHFTDASLQALARGCRSLEYLGLTKCCGLTDAGIVPLASSCGSLLTLYLAGCPLTDEGVMAIARGCPKLQCLSLGNRHGRNYANSDFHDSSIVALAAGCRRLKDLSLSAPRITDTAIQALAHNCRDLQDVTIACDMTDVGLIALARCPLLLHVDLGTPKITDDGIVSLSNIDHLDLRNCNRVSPAAICRVVQCSPTLTYLSFWDCALLTYDIVFFHLYENVEGIIRSRKDLMLNTFDFMDEPRRVPQEVCDELGIQLPEPESDY